MRQVIEFSVRVALLAFILSILWWTSDAPLSNVMNLSIIVGGVLLVSPLLASGGVCWTGNRRRAVPSGQQRVSPWLGHSPLIMIDLARLFQKYTVCNRPGAAIELTEQDLRAIGEAVSKISVLGDRYPPRP